MPIVVARQAIRISFCLTWTFYKTGNPVTEETGPDFVNSEQAMITFWGMAEHRFSNVYNYQC